MRVCFSVGLLLSFAANVVLASDAGTQSPPRLASVVRVDTRSGRLVRTVVVSPRVVPVKVVPSSVAAGEPDAEAGLSAESNANATATAASVQRIVEEAAQKYDVDPLLVHSVIQVESGYNPNAVSPKGAQGLMQLIPSTARRFGVHNVYDVRENVEGGVRYLKYLNSLFPNDLRLTLAAYNAGEASVWKYGNSVPPYAETVQYVYRVGEKYGKARRAAAAQKPAKAPTGISQEEQHSPIQHYVDSEGRLHLETVPAAQQ
jgi:soluble lytic murein transglycosylase-like protein